MDREIKYIFLIILTVITFALLTLWMVYINIDKSKYLYRFLYQKKQTELKKKINQFELLLINHNIDILKQIIEKKNTIVESDRFQSQVISEIIVLDKNGDVLFPETIDSLLKQILLGISSGFFSQQETVSGFIPKTISIKNIEYQTNLTFLPDNRIAVFIFNLDFIRNSLFQDFCRRHNLLLDITMKDVNIKMEDKLDLDFQYFFPFWKILIKEPEFIEFNRLKKSEIIRNYILTLIILVTIILCFALFIYFIFKENAFIKNRTEFLSQFSHQLKTPLASIRLYTETLLRKINNRETSEYILIINNEAKKLFDTISNTLNLTKIETKKNYTMQICNLKTLFEDIINDFQPVLKKKNMPVTLNLNSTKELHADMHALKIAFSNIIDNCIKYSASESELRIDLYKERKYFRINIRDYGVGMENDQLKKIFKPFYRISNDHNNQIDGSGIGLYLTKKILKAHNAKIKILSKVNKGTIFIIRLPSKKIKYIIKKRTEFEKDISC